MNRFITAMAVTIGALASLGVGPAQGQINGLRIEEDATVIASVLGAAVAGEIGEEPHRRVDDIGREHVGGVGVVGRGDGLVETLLGHGDQCGSRPRRIERGYPTR